jgi:uncharacterized protein (DUF2384 family)
MNSQTLNNSSPETIKGHLRPQIRGLLNKRNTHGVRETQRILEDPNATVEDLARQYRRNENTLKHRCRISRTKPRRKKKGFWHWVMSFFKRKSR